MQGTPVLEGDGSGGFWVFAYGSLIWRPDFEAAERRLGVLAGYRRAFCLSSIHYRGTPEAPGLVLGLDAAPGAACRGVAYRVGAETGRETLAYLRERELVSYAYLERRLPVTLEDGRSVTAYAYVIDPDHDQYAKGLSLPEQAAIIGRASGSRGPNREYLTATIESLDALGIEDRELHALQALVEDTGDTPT